MHSRLVDALVRVGTSQALLTAHLLRRAPSVMVAEIRRLAGRIIRHHVAWQRQQGFR